MAEIFDGKYYENKKDVPDLAGFECVAIKGANVREYYGKSENIEKFKTAVDYVGNGSTAYCVDNGDLYIFFDNVWYKQ